MDEQATKSISADGSAVIQQAPHAALVDTRAFKAAAGYSALLLVVGIVAPFFLIGAPATSPLYDYLDKLGSYFQGIFSIIGMIWICATFYVQAQELAHQRLELRQQREANQDTARSFRIQFTLTMHNFALERLAQSIRNVLELAYEETPQNFLDADQSFSDGVRDAFFKLASNSETADLLSAKLSIGHNMLRYLIKDCLDQDKRIHTLLQSQDIPQNSLPMLYSEHPAHLAIVVFEDLIRASA